MLERAFSLSHASCFPENETLQKLAEEVRKLDKTEKNQEKLWEWLGRFNGELIWFPKNKRTLLSILGLRRIRFS